LVDELKRCGRTSTRGMTLSVEIIPKVYLV